MINWIKCKLGVLDLEKENAELRLKMQRQQEMFAAQLGELKKMCRVDADVGFRGNNTIVLTGVLGGKAFVRFYDVGDGDFKAMVEQIGHMKRYSLVRNVDAPPEFHGAFKL